MSAIKVLPRHERPREKLLEIGATGLRDKELLAILLRTGREGKRAIEIEDEILKKLLLKRKANNKMSEDKTTTIEELKDILKQFRDDRDWMKFHDAKNLAEAISIEASELQQLFLWQDVRAVMEKINNDNDFRNKVEEEFADVFIFCLNFANALGIDISKTVKNKIDINNCKYPSEKSKGRADKYDKL